MRMTSTGAFPRALAAARPPNPPPTITTRGVFDACSSAPLIELRLASFIHPFLKLLRPEISENLGFSRRPRWSGQRRTDGSVLIQILLTEWRRIFNPFCHVASSVRSCWRPDLRPDFGWNDVAY